MTRFTRAFFCILILSGIVLLATGCGRRSGKGANDDQITLTVSFTTGVDERYALEKVCKEFEALHPGIRVKQLYVAGGNYYDKVKVMMAGGKPPDLMWMGQGFNTFASRGAFLCIDELYGHIDPDKYYMEVVNWYKYDGKLYGFPYGVDVNCIFYNKDLFDEAGVPYPEPDWTVEKFLETAEKLTRDIDGDGRIDQYGFAGEMPIGIYGDSLLNDTYTKCLLDTPEAIRRVQLNVDLVKKYKVSAPRESELRNIGTQMAFLMGKIAMWCTMNLQLVELRRKVDAFDWDIAMMPKGTVQVTWASSSGFAVSRTTKHKKEAVELLKYLVGGRFVEELKGYSIPIVRAEARKMAENWTGPPEHFYLLLEMAKSIHPNPRVADITQIMTIMNRHIESVTIGKTPVKEAMKQATREIDNVLSED